MNNHPAILKVCARLSVLLLLAFPVTVRAQGAKDSSAGMQRLRVEADGQHDFDFEIGTWKTELRRLVRPLSGSSTWVAYTGTTVVRKIWDGKANLVELEVSGQAGSIKALSLRLYDPQTKQWSLNFANANGGGMAVPTVGGFSKGRGEFYDQETYNGRAIFVRFVISDITPNSCRFEQAYSQDGGKSWEVNWVAVDTRITGK
jgi:hypothetical protein